MKIKTVAIIFACLACAAISRADLIGDMGYDVWDDGDGVLACTYDMTEDVPESDYSLTIDGDHFKPRLAWEPGHLLGWFKPGHTSTKHITVTDNFKNRTTLDWTDYHIDVTMDDNFTISNPDIIIPNDWPTGSIVVTQPSLIGDDYVGRIDYYAEPGGTPVTDGDILKVKYKITFSGLAEHETHYWQQLTPTPEPGTFVLLTCGLVGLLVIRRRFGL